MEGISYCAAPAGVVNFEVHKIVVDKEGSRSG